MPLALFADSRSSAWRSSAVIALVSTSHTAGAAAAAAKAERHVDQAPEDAHIGAVLSADLGVTLLTNNSTFQQAVKDFQASTKYGAGTYVGSLRGGMYLKANKLLVELGGGLLNGSYEAISQYGNGPITLRFTGTYLVIYGRVGLLLNRRWSILGGAEYDPPLTQTMTISTPTGTVSGTPKDNYTPTVDILSATGRFALTAVVSLDANVYLGLAPSRKGHAFKALTFGGTYHL